ncbi:MAG: hypothetical protein K2O48_01690 [Prevotella sp.]|nr:hypothetical protein [Prevotella sp.]
MKKLIAVICMAILGLGSYAQQTISLAGAWDFSTTDSVQFNDYVMLPGSMLTNDKGNPVSIHTRWTGSLYDSSYYFNPYMEKYRHEGQMKFPFFLTPERHYVGRAWYHRTVYVPKSWKNQRVTLFLERPHIETTVYVNGHEVGHQLSLSTPHRYDVTDYIRLGDKSDVTICVYNGIENVCVGQDSHSVTDQTQGNWNGIVGRIELQAQWKKLNIRQVRIVPNVAARTVRVMVDLENHVDGLRFLPQNSYGGWVAVRPVVGGNTLPVCQAMVKEAEGNRLVFEAGLGDQVLQWDEYTPNLYQLIVRAGEDVYETTSVQDMIFLW